MNRMLRFFAAAAVVVGAAALVPSHSARADEAGKSPKPIKALLVIGGCCHDYARQKEILQQGISARAPVEFTVVHEGDGKTDHRHSIFEKENWWKGYDVVIHDECSANVKDVKFIENVLKAHKEGVPAVLLHCAMHNYRSEGYPKSTPWFEFTGLKTTGHGPQEPVAIQYTDADSPITKGLEGWTTGKEELYNNTAGGVEPTAKVLAKGVQKVTDKKSGQTKEAEAVVVWTNDYHGTKVFGTTLGHNNDTVADARYLNLITRGLLWSVGKLDDQHYKPSDKNVDVGAIKVEPKKQEKKAAAAPAPAGQELLVEVGSGCCGQS